MILCIPFYPLGYELILIPAGNNPDKPENNRITVLLRELQQLPPSRNIVKQCFGRTKKPINIPGSSRYAKFLRFFYILLVIFGTNFTHKRIRSRYFYIENFFHPLFFGVGGWICPWFRRQHKLCGVSWAQYSGVAGRPAEGRNGDDPWPTVGMPAKKTSKKQKKNERKWWLPSWEGTYPNNKGSWGPMIFLFS